MRFKYNPWVSMVAALLLAAILVLTCTGCSNTAEAAITVETTTEETTPPRFTVERAGPNIKIITDNETGVQYIAYIYNGSCGLAKLEG